MVEDVAVTNLQRSEVVAMINWLRQLTDSISAVQRMLKTYESTDMRKQDQSGVSSWKKPETHHESEDLFSQWKQKTAN